MLGRFITKSGGTVVLRYPNLQDVQIATEYINEISKENTFITFSGEQLTEDEEMRYIDDSLLKIEKGDMVKIYCFKGSELVAEGSVERDLRTRKRGLHRAMLGVSVKKEHRNDGIGRILMNALIDETKNRIKGIGQIILTVFGPNENAINLYSSLGFKEYGRLPEGLFYKDKYVDYVYMYMTLK